MVGFGLLGSGFDGIAGGLLFDGWSLVIVIIIPIAIIVIIPRPLGIVIIPRPLLIIIIPHSLIIPTPLHLIIPILPLSHRRHVPISIPILKPPFILINRRLRVQPTHRLLLVVISIVISGYMILSARLEIVVVFGVVVTFQLGTLVCV